MAKSKQSEPMSAMEALMLKGTVTKAAQYLNLPRSTFRDRLASEHIAGKGRSKNFGEVVVLRQQLDTEKRKNAALEAALKIAKEVAEPVKLAPYKSKKRPKSKLGNKHMFVPDVQAKDGVPLDHMSWAGQYAVEKQPDTIVIAGDVWDMPSLSSYDKGKIQFEGRRYKIDIEAGRAAMDLFLAPIRKAKNYRPRIVTTLGNHENRIPRAIEDNPILDGTIGLQDLKLVEMGVEVYPFLAAVSIDGVTYSHFFPRSARGKITQNRNGAPSANAQVVRQGGSCVAGHTQGLDATPIYLNGRLQWGIIAGSFYQHDEPFLTPQGIVYWRGVVMMHEVNDGYLNPMFVTLEYLRGKYA